MYKQRYGEEITIKVIFKSMFGFIEGNTFTGPYFHQADTLFSPTITRFTTLFLPTVIWQLNQLPSEWILPSAPCSRRPGLKVNIDLCVEPSRCVCSAGGQKQLALTSDGVWRQMSLNMQSGSTTRGGVRRCRRRNPLKHPADLKEPRGQSDLFRTLRSCARGNSWGFWIH